MLPPNSDPSEEALAAARRVLELPNADKLVTAIVRNMLIFAGRMSDDHNVMVYFERLHLEASVLLPSAEGK